MKTLRHTALLLATALGLVAASTAPPAAGLVLNNPCEPNTRSGDRRGRFSHPKWPTCPRPAP